MREVRQLGVVRGTGVVTTPSLWQPLPNAIPLKNSFNRGPSDIPESGPSRGRNEVLNIQVMINPHPVPGMDDLPIADVQANMSVIPIFIE